MEAKNMKGGMMAINTWFKPVATFDATNASSDKIDADVSTSTLSNKVIVDLKPVSASSKKSVKQASISSWVSDGVMVEEQSPVTSKKKGTVKQAASNKGQAKITKFFENTEE